MIAQRATTLLKSLSPKELSDFEDYLKSPYFNKNERCIRLYKLLRLHLTTETEITREILEKSIFKDKKPHRSYLSVLLSELTSLLRGFLGQEALKQAPLYKEHLVLQGLLKKNLLKLAASLLKNLEERGQFILRSRKQKKLIVSHAIELEKQHKSSLDTLLYEYLFIRDYQHFYQKSKHKAHQVDDQEILERLDEFYLAHRLIFTSEVYNLSRINNGEIDENLVGGLQSIIRPKHLKIPLVKLLYHTLMTMHECENESHLMVLSELLNEFGDRIQIQELGEIYTTLTNYCIRQALQKPDDFLPNLRKAYNIFKQQLRRGHLDVRHGDFPAKLKNIIGMACHLGEFEEAKFLLENYKMDLSKNTRESIYAFNLATIYFYEKQFIAAFTEINRVEKVHAYYEQDRQFLRLKIYYELIGESCDFEFLKNQTKSFREYVRTNKAVSTANRSAYLNFVRFLLKLGKIKEGLSKKRLKNQTVLAQLGKASTDLEGKEVMQKSWLLAAVAGLRD